MFHRNYGSLCLRLLLGLLCAAQCFFAIAIVVLYSLLAAKVSKVQECFSAGSDVQDADADEETRIPLSSAVTNNGSAATVSGIAQFIATMDSGILRGSNNAEVQAVPNANQLDNSELQRLESMFIIEAFVISLVSIISFATSVYGSTSVQKTHRYRKYLLLVIVIFLWLFHSFVTSSIVRMWLTFSLNEFFSLCLPYRLVLSFMLCNAGVYLLIAFVVSIAGGIYAHNINKMIKRGNKPVKTYNDGYQTSWH